MSPADAWQRSGTPSDRSYPSGRTPRVDRDRDDSASRSVRKGPPPPRNRPETGDRVRPAERMRTPERRHPGVDDGHRRPPADRHPEAPRPRAERGALAERGPVEAGGSRLRGIFAVLGVFLVTLAACGVESFLGSGLGTVTLVALVGSAALAALLVRRRDLASVLVAPPLVFVAVAAIDVAVAPSASFSLATLASLLIRGFPAMAIATGVAMVIGLIRLAARR